jgi:hypothetical protein
MPKHSEKSNLKQWNPPPGPPPRKLGDAWEAGTENTKEELARLKKINNQKFLDNKKTT